MDFYLKILPPLENVYENIMKNKFDQTVMIITIIIKTGHSFINFRIVLSVIIYPGAGNLKVILSLQ